MVVEIVCEAPATGIDLERHIFATPGYLAAKGGQLGWLVSEDFVLPFYVERILVFRRLIFTTAPIPRHPAASASAEQRFMDEVVAAVRRAGLCDFIAKPQANAVFACAPAAAVVAPWGTYEVSIDRPDAELLAAFHQKHRNVIGKAQRDGITIEPITRMEVIYECVRGTLVRQGLPYYPSLRLLETLWTDLDKSLLSLGAFDNGQLQGVALVPFDRERGYYLYGGSIEKPHSGALNLLQFEVMRQLRQRGVKLYDLVGARIDVRAGTKYEGIQRFKARFGAQLRTGLTFRVVLSRPRFWLFQLLMSVYFRLKGRRYVEPVAQLVQGDYE